MTHYTTPVPIKTSISLNSRLKSKFKIDNKLSYLDNLSLENLGEKLILSKESDLDTNIDSDVSVKLDTSEPHITRTNMDSVTAVLAVQKLVAGNQSSTKLKNLSRSRKNNLCKPY